jgi:hypothetical protein
MVSGEDLAAVMDLGAKLRILLPPEYQETYQTLEPRPMRSAGLKYGADGRVAWDEIWGSFCDLAMAGGPPHKGTLLEPGTVADIEAQPDRYQEVVEEIVRGVTMATDLPARLSPHAGWIRVECYSEVMAGWLLRAIVMENVAVRADGRALDLPAAPGFRLDKEIKNVVTVIAKTCHYWMGHIPREQKAEIAALFETLSRTSPLIEPEWSAENGTSPSKHQAGWRAVECPHAAAAIWMMRAMVVHNVLARREGAALFVPVNRATDPRGERVADALARVRRLADASHA